jgi:hypothetical protein
MQFFYGVGFVFFLGAFFWLLVALPSKAESGVHAAAYLVSTFSLACAFLYCVMHAFT